VAQRKENKKDLSNYAEVKDRIRIFYAKYPDGRIITELLEWRDDGVIVMRAKVFRNLEEQLADCPIAIGHAYEDENQGYVNKTSALENCETSAVGRALALSGISIEKSIASLQEIEAAIERAEQMEKDGTMNMPVQLRRRYGMLLKAGQRKGMDQTLLYKLATFVRGDGEMTEEVIDRAMKVVEKYDPKMTAPEEVIREINQIAKLRREQKKEGA